MIILSKNQCPWGPRTDRRLSCVDLDTVWQYYFIRAKDERAYGRRSTVATRALGRRSELHPAHQDVETDDRQAVLLNRNLVPHMFPGIDHCMIYRDFGDF